MTITLHGIANCDTVKKARAWLGERGTAYVFRDYKKTPPTAAELRVWVDEVGAAILVNRAGTTWRKLPEADRAPLEDDPDGAAAIALMIMHPSLIKRPVLTGVGALLVGFKPDHWSAQVKG